MTLKLFVNIAQSFLSIFQQGNITAKYNLLHMMQAVHFKDNHTGKQTHEKEATSVFCFQIKVFVSVFGFGVLLCNHKTHRGGQEAIFALLSVPRHKQPVPWLVRFLLVLQLPFPTYALYCSKLLCLQDQSHGTSMLSLPSHPRYEKNALVYSNITFSQGFVQTHLKFFKETL